MKHSQAFESTKEFLMNNDPDNFRPGGGNNSAPGGDGNDIFRLTGGTQTVRDSHGADTFSFLAGHDPVMNFDPGDTVGHPVSRLSDVDNTASTDGQALSGPTVDGQVQMEAVQHHTLTEGVNTAQGDAGVDIFYVGGGTNTASGGDGAETFYSGGTNPITDFSLADGDTIHINADEYGVTSHDDLYWGWTRDADGVDQWMLLTNNAAGNPVLIATFENWSPQDIGFDVSFVKLDFDDSIATVFFPEGQNVLKLTYTYSDPFNPVDWRPELHFSNNATYRTFDSDQTIRIVGTDAYETIDLYNLYPFGDYMIEKPLTFTLNEYNEIVGHYFTEVDGGPTQQFILSKIDEIRTGIQQSAVFDLAGYDNDLNLQLNIPKDLTVQLGDGDNTIYIYAYGIPPGILGNHDITVGNGDNNISAVLSRGSITVGNGNNTIATGASNDQINGGGPDGTVRIVDEGGNNTIDMRIREADITTGAGADTIRLSGYDKAVINDAGGDNVIELDGGVADITTGMGNDTITITGRGNNTINDAGGDNVINVTGAVNAINTGDGNDQITVHDFGNNTITDTGGNNIITVGYGVNLITVGSGDDRITAGDGFNFIKSSNGSNTITVADSDSIIRLYWESDEAEQAGEHNVLNLGNGDNTIAAGRSMDSITAGDGNNSIFDTGGVNTIELGHGNNWVEIAGGYNSITLGDGNNEVHVADGANTITVGDGSNIIYSGTGDNQITAGDGGNVIDAGGGSDRIMTGSGDDIIYTGVVRDGETTFIIGGGGTDEFHLQGGHVWIDDFSMAENDQIFFEAGAYSDQGVSGINDLSMNIIGDTIFIESSTGDTLLTIELKDGVPTDFDIRDEITFEAPALVSASPQTDLFDF